MGKLIKEVEFSMNPIEVAALASIAVGDIVIMIALSCALILIIFNVLDSKSSFSGRMPNHIMFFGWLCFVTVFGGLIIASTSGVDGQQSGLAFGMSIGIKAVLLLVVLLLLSMGTSWRLSARR
jgi:hypothetical protein